MLICGLKLTHDGSVALIKDGKLLFSIEMEKLNNNPRYSEIHHTELIAQLLQDQGYDPNEVDIYAIDGWGGYNEAALAIQPRLDIGTESNALSVAYQGSPYKLDIMAYHERNLQHNVLERREFAGLRLDDREPRAYESYLHAAGHIMSAYCTSPYAQRSEGSYILIWDGGMYPRLYYFDSDTGEIENLGPIFLLVGNIYTIFSQHFGPFKVNGNFAKDSLAIAGKVMAYIALGNVKRELFEVFDHVYAEHYQTPMGFANIFANEFKKIVQGQNFKDEDILATFHAYLEELLVAKLKKKIARYNRKHNNLCIAGGCGLNIKWNSAIRESGLFTQVYVPPFPNDSGSAIGAACCAMLKHEGISVLDWNVYSGPSVIVNEPMDGWERNDCTLEQLAQLLADTREPVIFMNGKAELGPRALGNRSIIASPESPRMKDILNLIKKREAYRPVSPICLEQDAQQIFEPGYSDPYMLFDHTVKRQWEDRLPAIRHLDGTARLQTVSESDNPVVYELLVKFKALSGIPLLCNTSANLNGSGFFPDIQSATRWDQVNYVYCDGILYERAVKIGTVSAKGGLYE